MATYLKIFTLIRLIGALLLVVFPLCALGEVGVEIITYGDSITAGLIRTINNRTSAECREGVALRPSLSGSGNLRCFGLGREGVGGYQPFLKDKIESIESTETIDVDIYNFGSSGIETGALLSELGGVFAERPSADYILILGGANDAYDDVSSSTVKFNLETMVSQACSAGKRVLLGTITKHITNSVVNSKIKSYNNRIRNDISAPSDCEFVKVELYDVLKLSSGNYGEDGLHLSSQGNRLMADTWFIELEPQITPPQPEPSKAYLNAIYLLLLDE